ncbi:MAG: prepilin-type N-terminal cleavage/methylation domain-containing protein [Roseburia sp.]|nr:prepilin-type N-terminal cleavage/methylation domain-containing protein [Roseburia sp.]
MKWCRDHKGMSLVEIILVLAIMGIMTGVSATLIGHIYYANTKKAVEEIDATLSKQRVEAMSHKDTIYLYIYSLSDGYYMKQLSEELYAFDSSKMTSDGIKLCGGSTTVLRDGTAVDSSHIIRIAYKRSGVFDTTDVSAVAGISGEKRTNVTTITVSGRGSFSISLTAETGKHYVN